MINMIEMKDHVKALSQWGTQHLRLYSLVCSAEAWVHIIVDFVNTLFMRQNHASHL